MSHLNIGNMGKSRKSPNARGHRSPPRATQPSGNSSAVDSSAETVPYVPTIGTRDMPSSSENSVSIAQPPPKEKVVVDLTSKFSPLTNSLVDGKHSHHESLVKVPSVRNPISQHEPLTALNLRYEVRVLHCKGIVYSKLSYDTLRERTPFINDDLADWVRVGALLMALTSSGRIREESKADKRIDRTGRVEHNYAIGTLTELLMQWVNQGSDARQTPRVLMRKRRNEWCYPSGVYNLLSESDENSMRSNGCPNPHGYSLAKWTTKQTGLQPSYADWSYIESIVDTGGNLGLPPNIPSHQPVLQMVYSQEILIATPRKSRSTAPDKVVSSISSPHIYHLDDIDDEESTMDDIDDEESTTKSDDNEEDDDEDTPYAKLTDEAEEPNTMRYVTCILHSPESIRTLRNSTQLGSFDSTRV